MDPWKLPTSLDVNGKEYSIRSDFRVILDILSAMNDPDIFGAWHDRRRETAGENTHDA